MRATIAVLAALLVTPLGAAEVALPIPLDRPLLYRVTYLGIHCADLTLESAAVDGKPSYVDIVMTVQTTQMFDGIYKVRSRIESRYNVRRLSTRRYHEVSTEKDRQKDDLWIVDPIAGQARRTKNGKLEKIDVPVGGAHDPLAMMYRFRGLITAPGDEASVTVMTSRGAVEALAVAERWEHFETLVGEVDGLKVVQAPVGEGDFGRGGGLTMWLAADEQRTPYRIDFDLPFGKLVAELTRDEQAGSESAPEVESDPPRAPIR